MAEEILFSLEVNKVRFKQILRPWKTGFAGGTLAGINPSSGSSEVLWPIKISVVSGFFTSFELKLSKALQVYTKSFYYNM